MEPEEEEHETEEEAEEKERAGKEDGEDREGSCLLCGSNPSLSCARCDGGVCRGDAARESHRTGPGATHVLARGRCTRRARVGLADRTVE